MEVIVSKSQSRDDFEQAFFTAVEEGKKDKVTELLEMVNPNIQDVEKWTALMIASYRGHIKVVELLIKAKQAIQ